jgi:mono/diheme cytochrome c family protein
MMHPKGVWISGRYNVGIIAMRTCVITVVTLGLASLGMAKDKPLTRAQVDFFEAKIRPVLATHCFECHGSKDKGGLKLDSREAALKGGDSGAVIVPGKPKKSLLIKAVKHLDEDLAMPPKKKLPAHVISDLSNWIREGAAWPEGKAVGFATGKITDKQREHWAFQPLKKIEVAEGHPVDALIQTKLNEQKLKQVKLADSRTLIRRAAFDLTGLPPSPSEVTAFLADQKPGAWGRLVERLLASPHYGERWGRHWLDLVRYADTAGDAGDYPVPEAYKYRNYVIDAFNKDKPYDQFVREQIAGDQLPAASAEQRWEQTIGTGFIAISRRIGVSPHKLKHITIEDTINNMGKTFLGLTIGCARCHDHKFDPIPTADYYALYGMFDSSVYPHPGAEHSPHRHSFVYQMGKENSDERLRPYRQKLASWDKKERIQFDLYQSFQKKVITANITRQSVWAELEQIRHQRGEVAKTFPELDIAYAIIDGEVSDAQIHRQGDPKAKGAKVRRGFLQILGGQKLPEDAKGSGRLQLAHWLTEPSNPLTARVMVNRIWHYHFGRGLVSSTSDFGVRGTTPTHPELLDYLAAHFMEHGWSVKEMHRLIMSSVTYRLSTTEDQANLVKDPDNHFLWRVNRRRLDAEELRDSLLTFSAQLDLTPGGRHPFPHRLTYFYRQHEPFQEKHVSNKRSVYQMQQRIQKNPYLDMFDGPDGGGHLGERKTTVTTLQALYFMNSEFIHEQAQAIVECLPKEGQVEHLYELIFNRPASEVGLEFAKAYFAKDNCQQRWAGYVRSMLSSNEFLYVD